MAGLYIHIPFCHQACSYCDFHFVTNMKRSGEMVAAIAREIELRRDFLSPHTPLQTIYLGGGTPSTLSESELEQLFESIGTHFSQSPDTEITLEANPDDLSPSKLTLLSRLGVNRLSIGIQSFREEDLRGMNRSHSAEQALACVKDAQAAGIRNLSLDLIFGLPGMSFSDWDQNLDTAISLQPTHLSLYALTVEKRTALHHQVEKGKVELPEDAEFEQQFLRAHERLQAAGYEHYELSNYALPGHRSRHNGNYWKGVPYLGVGPSAHSFKGASRAWNIANNSQYLRKLSEGLSPVAEEEILSLKDRYHEYLMTGLRTVEGINLDKVLTDFGQDMEGNYSDFLTQLQAAGRLWRKGAQIGLTPSGWIISDQIIREMFLE